MRSPGLKLTAPAAALAALPVFIAVFLPAVVLSVGGLPAARAADPEAAADAPSIEAIRSTILALESSQTASPDRGAVIVLYRRALESLERAAVHEKDAARLVGAREQAAAELAAMRNPSEDGSARPALPSPANPERIVALLLEAQQRHDRATADIARLEGERRHRGERIRSVATEASLAAAELERLETALAAAAKPLSASLQREAEEAEAVARAARMIELKARLEHSREELLSFQGNVARLAEASHRAACREEERLRRQVAFLREAEGRARREEALAQVAKAEAAEHAALASLARDRLRVIESIEAVNADLTASRGELVLAHGVLHRVTVQPEHEGDASRMGRFLRKQRAMLPDIGSLDRRLERARRVQASLQADLVEADESFQQADLAAGHPLARGIEDGLRGDRESGFRVAVDSEAAVLSLRSLVGEGRETIDRRILWARSAELLGTEHWQRAARGLAQLVESVFRDRFRGLLHAGSPSPTQVALVAFAVSGLFPAFWRRLLGTRGAPLFEELAAAAALPALAAAIGLWIAATDREGYATLGESIVVAAWIWLPLETLRAACRRGGLVGTWLGWERPRTQLLRSVTGTLVVVGLPLVVLVAALHRRAVDPDLHALERVAFLLLLGLLARSLWFGFPATWQSVETSIGLVASGRFGTWARLGTRGMILSLPILLAAASVLGFHETSVGIATRFHVTLAILVAMAIAVSVVHVMGTLEGLTDPMATRAAGRVAGSPAGRRSPLAAIVRSGQGQCGVRGCVAGARRLVRRLVVSAAAAGVFAVWYSVVPGLDDALAGVLWLDPKTAVPVTLGRLVAAFAILWATWLVARDLPAGLEYLSAVRRAAGGSADRADGRHAFAAILRYATIAVGLCVASAAIGVGWDRVQWLVAAMTFGLGFGLQEIFANFASGIILLLERPVRPGDTVTVGNVTGVVSRIRMRATTVTDWDCRELVVPNREFITGQLINWTLSSHVLRVVLKVGIAYGSDTEQAEKCLLAAAASHPRVLANPGPMVLFTRFGESTLDFELWCYVHSVDDYLTIPHDLNLAIDRAFREHGIEIAFPQSDIHVRSVDPAVVSAGLRQAMDKAPDDRGAGGIGVSRVAA